MGKIITVLSKVPWQPVTKIGGTVLLATSSVIGAMKRDEITQKVVVTLANKAASKLLKK